MRQRQRVGRPRAAAQHLVVRRRRTPRSTPGTGTTGSPGSRWKSDGGPLPDVAEHLLHAARRRARRDTSRPASGGSGSGRGWRARRSAPSSPQGKRRLRAGRGVPATRPSPTRPRWAAAGRPSGRTRRPRTSRRAAPARRRAAARRGRTGAAATVAALAEPERRRRLPGLAAPLPAGRGPQPLVVVAAGLDERAVGAVGDRRRVDEERRARRPRARAARCRRPRGRSRCPSRTGPPGPAPRRSGSAPPGAGQARRSPGRPGRRDELVGGEHRLVVLVLVLDDHAVDEARVEQLAGPGRGGSCRGRRAPCGAPGRCSRRPRPG